MNIVFYVLLGIALGIIYVAASNLFYVTGKIVTKIINKFKDNLEDKDENRTEESN